MCATLYRRKIAWRSPVLDIHTRLVNRSQFVNFWLGSSLVLGIAVSSRGGMWQAESCRSTPTPDEISGTRKATHLQRFSTTTDENVRIKILQKS